MGWNIARGDVVVFHGGDLVAAEGRFGRPLEGWLDLSTGINPIAYPVPRLPQSCWSRLPSSDAGLRAAAAQAYGVTESRLVVPAPGVQALIQLLPWIRRNIEVAVLAPTYEEHRAAWQAAGHRVREMSSLDELGRPDVVVVVNPNNPDGRIIPADKLLYLAAELADRGGFLVLDESFADVTPKASLAEKTGRPGLVILRSFGKFFGLAGVRLGFALADPGTAESLRSRLGPWPVSGPALVIGESALIDDAWIGQTKTRLSADAARLDEMLLAKGLSLVGGTPLFRLVESPKADALYEHLGRRGILVRAFAAQTDRLRFGLPGSEADWQRLAAALREWV